MSASSLGSPQSTKRGRISSNRELRANRRAPRSPTSSPKVPRSQKGLASFLPRRRRAASILQSASSFTSAQPRPNSHPSLEVSAQGSPPVSVQRSGGHGVEVRDQERSARNSGGVRARRPRPPGSGDQIHLSGSVLLAPHRKPGRLVQRGEQPGGRLRSPSRRGVGADQGARSFEEAGGKRHGKRGSCHGDCPRSNGADRARDRRAQGVGSRLAIPTKEKDMDQKPTPFLSDIQEIRRRAREHVEKGAVTPDYKANLETAL